ncbi:polysaccharide pyruvyl transferase family protein [Epilithonimonas sp.]|uniref:polysaccharide pyruvyl transferase family protein n=1 Tax=Epilithonimonas sp. TaxID=2894511 RepID=UPI00289B735E|nr:polysaccharide pyruvyl transferase family protein [Epilithonimonas sp.]
MKKKIALFGPHDRFNYGDLLFAIMLEYGLNKVNPNKFDFKKYALVDADFSNKGGFKTYSYRSLKNDINNKNIDAVIVAGGECLRAEWNGLYSFINPLYFKIFRHPKIPAFFKKNSWIKLLLGGKSDNPYLIDKKDFKNDIKVIYNSVGGGNNMAKDKLEILRSGDYISLREQKSSQYVQKNLGIEDVYQVPDSAIIMDDVYPKAGFTTNPNIPANVKEIFKEKYILFQISKYKNDNKLNEIAEQLKKLAILHNIKIVLCPIGTANGHEDHIPLGTIHQKIKDFSVLINDPSIETIMGLIAHSQLYIGNSLHGIITAMSYNLPYIALNKKQIKIIYYLDSWATDGLKEIQDIDDFVEKANFCLQTENLSAEINKKTTEQKELYYASLKRISNTILENERI